LKSVSQAGSQSVAMPKPELYTEKQRRSGRNTNTVVAIQQGVLRLLAFIPFCCVLLYFSALTTKNQSYYMSAMMRQDNNISRRTDDIALLSGQDEKRQQQQQQQEKQQQPICRVALENKMDYHYEIIESTILRYPLPWEELGCNITTTAVATSNKPIVVFDVALTKHIGHLKEKEGWEEYFEQYLRGTIRDRADGMVQAQFGDLVDYTNYTWPYAAVIGVSCDSYNYKPWLLDSSSNFCVLHGWEPRWDQSAAVRSCWLNPMHKEYCFFIPSDFPQFPSSSLPTESTTRTSQKKLNVCVSGGNRVYDALAKAAASYVAIKKDSAPSIRIKIFQRPQRPIQQTATIRTFENEGVLDLVQFVHEPRYLDFQKAMSECDILTPLIDPERNFGYFPNATKTLKKLTGSLPQAIGYKIPLLVHADLYPVYKDHLTAPCLTYNDTESFTSAMSEMIAAL